MVEEEDTFMVTRVIGLWKLPLLFSVCEYRRQLLWYTLSITSNVTNNCCKHCNDETKEVLDVLWGWIDFLVLCHLQALLGFEGSQNAKSQRKNYGTILRFVWNTDFRKTAHQNDQRISSQTHSTTTQVYVILKSKTIKNVFSTKNLQFCSTLSWLFLLTIFCKGDPNFLLIFY